MDIIIVIALFILIGVRLLYLINPRIDIAYGAYKDYRILLWYNSYVEGERKYITLYTHEQR